MGWLPKSVVCLRYYECFRFRSDLTAALVLASQIFPGGIAIAIAYGVRSLYDISCATIAGFLASGLGDSKVRQPYSQPAKETHTRSIERTTGIPSWQSQ